MGYRNGAFKWVGHLWLKWVGQFGGDMLKKNYGAWSKVASTYTNIAEP